MKNSDHLFEAFDNEEISPRLFNVMRANGVTTFGEMKEYYNNLDKMNLPRNMGKKSFTEMEEFISHYSSTPIKSFSETLNEIQENRAKTNIKTIIKKLHSEVFYKDEIDVEKLQKLAHSLNYKLKNF